MITQQQLQNLYDYVDGQLKFKHSRGKRKTGSYAGSIKPDGYWRVYINGKGYYLHRLIWMYHYGYFPNEIDHIDRNKSNNTIENLRAVTHKENQAWMIGKSLYDRECRF